MGFSVRYQAVPERSRFYARLREDRAFPLLLMALFPHGAGVFDFLASEPEAAATILEGAAARLPGTFGPVAEARRRVAEFRAEAERTRRQFPGIETLIAALGESSPQVEGRLEAAVLRDPRRAAGWGRKLVYGDRRLTPGRLQPAPYHLGDHSLRAVSLPLVRRGAQILLPLPPSTLFAGEGWEGQCRDEYRRWRRLYLAAAERSDVLLVRELLPADTPPLPSEPQRLPRPCLYCGAPLRTRKAKQCFECGMDWHDSANVVCR
jgi:hypothetical protein